MRREPAPVLLASVLMLGIGLASPAWSAPRTHLSASFNPERLGASTTVAIAFQIGAHGGIPSPLTAVDLRFPSNLGFATSGLGVATCTPQTLQQRGPAACPPNSVMGAGGASARFQIGPEVFQESSSIAIVAGPSQDGYVRPLISATGLSPVATRIVMPTVLLPGHLRISVPLVASLPEGPDVALVSVHVTLGGALTYYERVHGRLVRYRPRGIALPSRCPRAGFRFAASFAFLDGTHSSASTVVRCPGRGGGG